MIFKSEFYYGRLGKWLAIIVAITLPFKFIFVSNLSVILWAAYNIYFYITNKTKRHEVKYNYLIYLSPLLLFILLLISLPLCSDDECVKINLSFIERYIPFFLFPVIFLTSTYQEKDVLAILDFFSISVLLQLLLLIPEGAEAPNKPYLGMYGAFIVGFCIHTYFKNRSSRHLFVGLITLLLLIIIGSKTAVGISIIIIVFITSTEAIKHKKTIVVLASLTLLFCLILFYLFYSAVNVDYMLGALTVKTYSWTCTWEAYIKSGMYFFGTGVGQSERALTNIYHTYPNWMGWMGYNAHNQYLETLLSQGILGLGVLITWYGAILIESIRNNNKFLFYFIIGVILSSMTESILWRQKGIIYLLFFVSVLIQKPSTKTDNPHHVSTL